MAKRKTTPPPPAPAEEGIPPAPTWLRKSCRATYLDHCRRLRDDGVFLRSLDAHFIGRLCHSEEDLQVAESEAAKVPAVMESRANGTVISAIHKRVSELRGEVRAWLKQLPHVPSPRTSPTASALRVPPNPPLQSPATDGAPRLELIDRIRARIASMQQQQSTNNPTAATPTPTTPAAPTHNAAG